MISCTKWVVTDCEFNRHWNRELIGKRFDNPPSYCAVKEENGLATQAKGTEQEAK